MRIAWAPVRGAAKYRARWIDGKQTVDYELAATTPVLEHAEFRAGQHRIQIVAIDANGVESPPAEVAVEVVTIHAIAPGADSSVPAAGFALGARFSSPNLVCELGAGARGTEVIATKPGSFNLRCSGGPAQPVVEVPVVIAPVRVSAETAPIQRGTRTEIHITIASTAPIGDRIEVDAVGDLDLGKPERVEGGIDVRVTPREGTTGGPPGTVDVGPDGRPIAREGLVIRAGSFELGRISLDIVEAPPPPSPATTKTLWFALDLSAYFGAFTTPHVGPDANLLGKPTNPMDTLSGGPLAGIRLGIYPTRRVGLEAEFGIATPSYVGRLGFSALAMTRGQLAARLVEDGRFGLRGLVGADLLTVLTDAGTSQTGSLGGVHWGGAFSVETRRNVSVRFQALHVITVAQDAGFAHCVEVQIGVVTRLGRRDRWN